MHLYRTIYSLGSFPFISGSNIVIDEINLNIESTETTAPNKKQKTSLLNTKLAQIELENKNTLAMQRAAEILREYLNSTTKENRESWLVTTLRGMCNDPEPERKMHSFIFENNKEAADWNQKVLESYDNNFNLAIKHQKGTVMAPGSEFRALNKIKSLWQYRENWETIEETLTKGAIYPLKNPPDEEHRMQNLIAMIERGNHKSSKKTRLKEALLKRTEKDIKRATNL